MMKLQRLLISVFCTVLCFAVILTSAVFLLNAEESFSMRASDVTDGAFTVTIEFPKVEWNTYNLVITYDHTKIQTAKPTYSVGGTIPVENIDDGNASGTYKLGAVSLTSISGEFSITMPFTVKDTNATEVQISMTITEFGLTGTGISASAPSPITVTLKTVAPPPSSDPSTSDTSSDTNTSSDTTTTSTNTDSDTSTTTSSTDTSSDTSTTSTSTKTDTSTKTSTKTSDKTSSTSDSDATTDAPSDSDTDTDNITDSETGFPFSSVSGSNTNDPTTDVTDSPVSSEDLTESIPSVTVPAPTTSTLKQPVDDGKISTGTVAAISIGVAILLCAGLTVLGLMRHKKEE